MLSVCKTHLRSSTILRYDDNYTEIMVMVYIVLAALFDECLSDIFIEHKLAAVKDMRALFEV